VALITHSCEQSTPVWSRSATPCVRAIIGVLCRPVWFVVFRHDSLSSSHADVCPLRCGLTLVAVHFYVHAA
jgi:hypothetical protein